jgi:hypothetical protein
MNEPAYPAPAPVLASPAMVPVPAPVRIVEPTLPDAPQPELDLPAPPTPGTPHTVKSRDYRQADDVYITRFAGELSYIHVLKDIRLDATVGQYHSQPESEAWQVTALMEAARMSRARSMIRVHTTEPDLVTIVRDLQRRENRPEYVELKNFLNRTGRSLVVARPERESPIWREVMKLMKEGKMLMPSPLVTYLVHTAALTDYEQVYCGVVMIGLGSIVVHAHARPGDDLVDAELEMMNWVLQAAGGGGRIDVHHASDGARRIWEQAEILAQQEGTDALGHAGSRVRAIAREALRMRTYIMPARKPYPTFDRFARLAAGTHWANTNLV